MVNKNQLEILEVSFNAIYIRNLNKRFTRVYQGNQTEEKYLKTLDASAPNDSEDKTVND